MHEMQLADDPGDGLPPLEERQYVSATMKYYTLHNAFRPLAQYPQWRVAWYRLESSTFPLAHVSVKAVPVVFLGRDGHVGEFWPPPAPMPRGKRARGNEPHRDVAPKPHLSPITDVVDDGDGDGSSSDSDEGSIYRGPPSNDGGSSNGDNGSGDESGEGANRRAKHKKAPPPQESDPPPPTMNNGEGHGVPPRRDRKRADATYHVHTGKLSFYERYNNFEATCGNPEHGCCKMTRKPVIKAMGKDGQPRGGRVLGFLSGWLSLAFAVKTREEHKDAQFIAIRLGSQASRSLHRAASISIAAGRHLAPSGILK